MNKSIKFSTLVELLRWRTTYQANQRAYTFLVDGERDEIDLTYGELDQQAQAIAAQLQQMGAVGERALLLYPPGLEFIAAFFACLYAGVVAVPTYPPRRNRADSRLSSIALDSQATIALSTAEIISEFSRRQKHSPELKLDVDEVCLAIRQALSEEHELELYALSLLRRATIPKTIRTSISN